MNATSSLRLRLPSLQSIFFRQNHRTNCYASAINFEGLTPSHQSSRLHNFNGCSSFFSAMQIFFSEVPRTWHWRRHSLGHCMDYFSLCALANKLVQACFCLQSPKHTRAAIAPTISPFLYDCWQNITHRKIDNRMKWNVTENERREINMKIKHAPPEDMHHSDFWLIIRG